MVTTGCSSKMGKMFRTKGPKDMRAGKKPEIYTLSFSSSMTSGLGVMLSSEEKTENENNTSRLRYTVVKTKGEKKHAA